MLLPFIGVIVFTGVYPKPMLERIEPSVDRLVAHIEDHSSYDQPDVAGHGTGEPSDQAAEGDG